MHRVVIVGAGFAGLAAARALVGKPVEVTIVDQRNFHTFQPMLYEVATAGLDPGDVAYPIRVIFGKAPNVTFRFAEVTGVDWNDRHVTLEDATPLPFDSVIVASGATAKFFGIPGAAECSLPLYTLNDARKLRDHVLRRFEEADADPSRAAEGLLTFVVVGGGPTGVEVAGALAELLDVAVRRDGFTFARSMGRIILVDGLDRLLTPFKEDAAAYAADTLRGRGIELRLGRRVKEVTNTCVELDDGTDIPTGTVVWAGGVTVEDTVASHLSLPSGPNGRLRVEADLSIPGHEDAYAVGDAAAVPWGPGARDPSTICPQLAQVAIQSGSHAARQVLHRLAGEPTEAFRYRDKGIMATIGRRAAITQFPGGTIVRGTLGWLSWLALHLVYLIGYRNKIVVLINWSWRYLSWGSGPRVIVGDKLELRSGPRPEGRPEHQREHHREGGGADPVSSADPV
ncbi:MAG: NAD(P)/FAD-dependent oxidoreductase [Acidimicrobiales bacterium]